MKTFDMILPLHYRWTISFEKLIKKEYHNFPGKQNREIPTVHLNWTKEEALKVRGKCAEKGPLLFPALGAK